MTVAAPLAREGRMGKQPALAAAFLLIAASAYGQSTSPQFDAVSIKVAGPETPPATLFDGGPGSKNPGRLTVRHIAMETLLMKAFDVGPDQIEGPKWLTDYLSFVYYNIEATMPPDTTKEQFLKMLQNMLAERFHLVFRRETRNFPGYELVVDKGGPKFKEVESDPDAPASPDPKTMLSAKRDEYGLPIVKGPFAITQISSTGLTREKYQEQTIAHFISTLGFTIGASQGKSVNGGFLQPRVVDKTGLKGRYSFILAYSGRALPPWPPPAPGNSTADRSAPVASDPSGGGPDIFTAIQKQLGLRLNKTADVPLDYIVIESVERMPTPN
jgi:uncharacterized protein (TIGR03435 family)